MTSIQAEPTIRTVPVSIEVKLEIHNRAEFQKEGHFVCGLKDRNNPILQRPWEGELVYILTWYNPHGGQMLRVMSDSPEGADLLMADAVRSMCNEYFMLMQCSKAADQTHAQMLKDFEALKTAYEGLQGPGAAVDCIRSARIKEALG